MAGTFKTQGKPGAVLSGASFTYDPQGGWSREDSYSGTFEELREVLARIVAGETGQGNPVKADLRLSGSGDRATATVHFPDGTPTGSLADPSQIQWGLEWQRRELHITAAPVLAGLSKVQIAALHQYARDTGQESPAVLQGDPAGDCNWPPGATGAALLNVCGAGNVVTPAAFNKACELIEKGITSWATFVPILRATGNLRNGAAQRRATVNIGRIFSGVELAAWEGFPAHFGYALPCAWWQKTGQTARIEGTRLLTEAIFEGVSGPSGDLYRRAKSPALGACCNGTTCTETTQADCVGAWLGPGVDCNDLFNPCDGCTGVLLADFNTRGACTYTDAAGVLRCADGVPQSKCPPGGVWVQGQVCSIP